MAKIKYVGCLIESSKNIPIENERTYRGMPQEKSQVIHKGAHIIVKETATSLYLQEADLVKRSKVGVDAGWVYPSWKHGHKVSKAKLVQLMKHKTMCGFNIPRTDPSNWKAN